jgi:hypothetical protein
MPQEIWADESLPTVAVRVVGELPASIVAPVPAPAVDVTEMVGVLLLLPPPQPARKKTMLAMSTTVIRRPVNLFINLLFSFLASR